MTLPEKSIPVPRLWFWATILLAWPSFGAVLVLLVKEIT